MNSKEISNKKILIIGPSNYNYPVIVKREMEKMGGEVHFYDERNNPGTIEKILLRKAKILMKFKIENYYSYIMKMEKNFKPDFVFFISPEAVTYNIIKNMKENFKDAKFILYMWDSIDNKDVKKIYKLFDRCLSFDKNDCKKYNFVFRPLFFSREYDKEVIENQFYSYDFGFIGTVHSDRVKIICKIMEYCDKNSLRYYFYIYVQGKVMFFINYIKDSNFRKLCKKNMVHTKTLDGKLVSEILSSVKCIIDINHPKQTGLTMRTMEMIGLKRKLLTTNANIMEYDFYNKANQTVIGRDKVMIEKNFLTEPYQPIDKKIYLKYRIDNWLRDIFDLNAVDEK